MYFVHNMCRLCIKRLYFSVFLLRCTPIPYRQSYLWFTHGYSWFSQTFKANAGIVSILHCPVAFFSSSIFNPSLTSIYLLRQRPRHQSALTSKNACHHVKPHRKWEKQRNANSVLGHIFNWITYVFDSHFENMTEESLSPVWHEYT